MNKHRNQRLQEENIVCPHPEMMDGIQEKKKKHQKTDADMSRCQSRHYRWRKQCHTSEGFLVLNAR